MLLIRLWAYCGKYHYDSGQLTGYSDQEIESQVLWWGKKGELITALQGAGFLDRSESGDWEIHHWQEHQGHIAAFKARSRAMAKARWHRARPPDNDSGAASNATRIATRNAPAVLAVLANNKKSKASSTSSVSTSSNSKESIGASRFVPPTLEEVLLTAAKTALPDSEARKFHSYYESNGWRVGRSPMKKWQAALVRWKLNWQESGWRGTGGRQQRAMTPEELRLEDLRIVREASQ